MNETNPPNAEDRELRCPSCGYQLRSLTATRCPECGQAFTVQARRDDKKKTMMRSLGEFFGHIFKAAKTDPGRTVTRKTVEEEQHGEITLRRTTIEEIEMRRKRQ